MKSQLICPMFDKTETPQFSERELSALEPIYVKYSLETKLAERNRIIATDLRFKCSSLGIDVVNYLLFRVFQTDIITVNPTGNKNEVTVKKTEFKPLEAVNQYCHCGKPLSGRQKIHCSDLCKTNFHNYKNDNRP